MLWLACVALTVAFFRWILRSRDDDQSYGICVMKPSNKPPNLTLAFIMFVKTLLSQNRPVQAMVYELMTAGLYVLPTYGEHYKGIITGSFAQLRLVALMKWQVAKKFMSDSVNIDKGFGYHFLHGWLGRGLLTGSGKHWNKMRRILNPVFHRAAISVHHDAIIRAANALSAQLCQRTNAVDLRTITSQWSLRALSKTVLGVDLDSIPQETSQSYIKSVHTLTSLAVARTLNPFLWFDFIYRLSPSGRRQARSLKVAREFTDLMISRRVTQLSTGSASAGSALVDTLIAAHQEHPEEVTANDIRDEVNTFVFAGHDTNAVALSFTLYIVGLMPSVQQRILNEVDCAIAEHGSLGGGCLSQLKYTEAVVKECLRIYPPVPMITRTTSQVADFSHGKALPGTNVLICIFALHSDAEYFPDPAVFQPERFLEATSQPGFIPFSAGPRSCIGQRLALQQLVLTLATIVKNCELRSKGDRDQMVLSLAAVLRCLSPLEVAFRARNSTLDV